MLITLLLHMCIICVVCYNAYMQHVHVYTKKQKENLINTFKYARLSV